MLTALDVCRWLRSLHEVPEPSVDRIIVGEPATVVRGIATVWMPTWAALKQAAARGANVVVAHEPTFFTHHDLDGFEAAFSDAPPKALALIHATRDAKRRWLEETGIVVVRCHDVVDAMPGGVVDCLVAGLGFTDADVVRRWNRYRVVRLPEPRLAGEVARRLATALAPLGQAGVAFYGDAGRRVQTLGLGTGYGCEPARFVELGADMGLSIHDRIKTWTEGEWAEDSGFPLAVIDHGASEEWGVRRLAELLRTKYDPVPVHLIPQGCSHRWVVPSPDFET